MSQKEPLSENCQLKAVNWFGRSPSYASGGLCRAALRSGTDEESAL